MRNNKFSVGQKVFYTDLIQKKVRPLIIQAIDKGMDGNPIYWTQSHFGYYPESLLYETHQNAMDILNEVIALLEKVNE